MQDMILPMFKAILVRNALLLPIAACIAGVIVSTDQTQRMLLALVAIVLEYARDMLGLMFLKQK